jgi:HemX protein
MQPLLGLANTLLPLLYVLLICAYVRVFKRDDPGVVLWSRWLTRITLVVHLGALVLRTLAFDRLPMGAPLEFFSLLAFSLLLIYAFIQRQAGVRETGFVVVAMAFLLQFLSSAFARHDIPPNPLLQDPGYAVHAVLVLMSYSALSLGFLYAILYLVLARQLARRQFGLLYRRLPPLETLERMSVWAVRLGAVLLFGSLVSGFWWMHSLADRVAPEVAARLSPLDPKIVTSAIVLLAYVVGLAGHHFLGWRGRRMNVVAIASFVLVIVSMAVVHHFFPSFHDFSMRGGA